MTFTEKPTIENKFDWYLPDFYPDVTGREDDRCLPDQFVFERGLVFNYHDKILGPGCGAAS
jgi:hypothetical protein